MSIERIVQIHIAVLTVVGAVLLGFGRGSPELPLLVAFAAVTSLIFTDLLGWFRLNHFVANLAALLALFFSLQEFLAGDSRSQLLAVANLLVYLQLVLFYQAKSHRLYWQLAVLSLLEVVVAAALRVGIEFGLVLIAYAATAISTMAYFFVYREIERVAGNGAGEEQRGALPAQQSRPRIRLLASPARLGQTLVGWGLAFQTAAVGVATLVFSLVLFFSTPRAEIAGRQAMYSRSVRLVGFSSEVRLREMSRILQSDEPVMRVSYRDMQTLESYRVLGDPYFRGAVFTEYVSYGGDSAWRQRRMEPSGSRPRASMVLNRFPNRPPRHRSVVRQDVTLEPNDSATLFAIFPVFGIEQTPDDVMFDPFAGRLFTAAHDPVARGVSVRYQVATTGLLGGLQLDITPHENRIQASSEERESLRQELEELVRFDAGRFPELKAVADAIVGPQQAAGARRAVMARSLRDHFLAPERYTYTLDFTQIRRTPGGDPIEDFVFLNRAGHCEYFASALVLMLRSQGIPARLVTGFHGCEFNALGDYYQVLQNHAHAWAEVYLEPDEMARELPPGSYVSPGGGWLRLDPTPGASRDRVRQVEKGLLGVVDDVLDYARLVWADYVLGLSAQRQRENIYNPVAEKAAIESWADFARRLATDREFVLQQLRRFAASPYGLATAAGIALLAAAVGWRIRKPSPARSPVLHAVRRLTSRLGISPADAQGPTRPVAAAFYARLESLLARAGLNRAASETPLEFAGRAIAQLREEWPGGPSPEVEVMSVVEAYYRVRFGRQSLAEGERERLEGSLRRVREAIAALATFRQQHAAGEPSPAGSGRGEGEIEQQVIS